MGHMKKTILSVVFAGSLLAFPLAASAMNFGYVDAAKLFSKYNETQKTKSLLETEKSKLQIQLDSKKKEVADLDGKYVETAKKVQALRDAKKDAEAKALEVQLKAQRDALANVSAELEKFFQESQKRLYELEDEKMGSLSQDLDKKVDDVIKKIATSKGLQAVFEKRFCYFGGTDITEDVIKALNTGAGAAPAPAVAPVKKGGK
jgi:Skp family chaperone for outer membrane proteins